MKLSARTLAVVVLASTPAMLVACDRSSELEDCVFSAEPELTTGSRTDRCVVSSFAQVDPRGREVVGVVRRGDDPISGAAVRIWPASDPAGMAGPEAIETLTDSVGFFGGLRKVALRYDLSARFDRNVLVFRGLAGRYFDPSLEGVPAPSRAWRAKVDVRFAAPVAEGHSVAFLASGDGVYGVTGDPSTGLFVTVREYATPAKIHAIEYETGAGLVTASSYASAEVPGEAGRVQSAVFALAPVTRWLEPTFVASSTSAFAPSSVGINIAASRTSFARLVDAAAGSPVRIPVIPEMGYTYVASVEGSDGVVSETGETGFDIALPETPLTFFRAPVVRSPAAGESCAPNELLSIDAAEKTGIFEHILAPASVDSEAPTIRIVTASQDVALPDVVALGGAPARGAYTWTVRAFPKTRFVEELSGIDSRRYRPVAVSSPRSILLR